MSRNLTRYYLMDGAIVRAESRTKRKGIRLLHKFPDLHLVWRHDTPSVRRMKSWEVRG